MSSNESESPMDENMVIQKFNELQSACNSLINKIAELEQDRNEHK